VRRSLHGRNAARRERPRDAARDLLSLLRVGRISRRAVAVLLALLPVAAAAAAESGASAAPTWRLAAPPADEAGATAVAVSADARWAMGDGRGVRLRDAAGAWRQLELRGAVRDLAFAPDGALWIASAEGLWCSAGGRLALRTPAPGDEDRDSLRVAVTAHAVAVATAGGVYWSRDGVRFARVEAALGESPAAGLALEEGAAAATRLWIASERGLMIAELPHGRDAVGIRAARVELPFDLRPALDVTVFGGRVLALGRTQLLERAGDGSFRSHPTDLPPGSTPIRVSAATGVVLIATDRGLVAAPAASGPWQRAAAPAGSTPAQDVAIAADQTLVAGSRGLLVASLQEAASAGPSPFVETRAASCDPPIVEVQRAALRYLHLAGDPAASMRRGVRLRGLLPIVTLEGRKGHGGDTRRSYDESYVSGGYRRLYDSDDFATHDRDVQMRFTWDLGDALYNPEEVDVSNEARRLIELRDDVLDELDQLYFDRRRALDAASAAADPGESARERLRAEELAAGLDAWTDGWFGRSAACSRP
jgi:hypothetical protein